MPPQTEFTIMPYMFFLNLFLFLSGSVTDCVIFYPSTDAGPVLFLFSDMTLKTYEIQNKCAELVMVVALCLEGNSSLKWVEH